MAYRIEDDEQVQAGLRRCAREQLSVAIANVGDLEREPTKALHDARKAIKRERSLLRLARPGLTGRDRRRENRRLRDAGRRLSAGRDADVLLATLDDLSDRYAGQFPKRTLDSVRDRFVEDRDLARQMLTGSGVSGEVTDELRAVRSRVDELELHKDGWSAVRGGLERSYRRGRRDRDRARRAPTPEALHQWRKRSKDLWYQLRLLERAAPGTMAGQAKDAHRLSDRLGELHDLYVLRDTLGRVGREIPVDLEPLLGVIEHRVAELQTEALVIGDRVYAEAPKRFERRVHRYWKAWRAASKSARSHRPVTLAEATRHPTTA